MKNKIKGLLAGGIIGDILGVPYEFCNKEQMLKQPCTGFSVGGIHDQPLYSWSDDTSMTLGLINSIVKNNYEHSAYLAKKEYLAWIRNGEYTFNGNVFDYGAQTRLALYSSHEIQLDEEALGNGALMRIHVLACIAKKNLLQEVFLTHPSYKNLYYCNLYLEIIKELLLDKTDLAKNLLKEEQIKFCAKGYVADTLILAVNCLLTTSNFKDCVLKAINYGGDTDTNGSVAGVLAGAYYGFDKIDNDLLDCFKNNDLLATIDKFIGGVENSENKIY